MVNENFEKNEEGEKKDNGDSIETEDVTIENSDSTENSQSTSDSDSNKAEEEQKEEFKRISDENLRLKEEIELLKNLLEKEKEERDKWVAAKEENTRREMNAEISSMISKESRRMIKWILNFYVDFEGRFLKFLKSEYEKDEKINHHIKAMNIMRDKLWNNLNKEGVEEIKLKIGSDIWDSNYHEFMGDKVNNDLPDSTVLEIIDKGFVYNGEVIKPAKVVISKRDK